MIALFKALVIVFTYLDDLPIALADITFTFPATCKYPCLSVLIPDFGLINPLNGRTVATLAEVHLALYLGATVKYHDAVVIEAYEYVKEVSGESDEDFGFEGSDVPYAFRTHLHTLFDLRNEAKDNNNELLQQLYKTYSNSLYGKTAQGISERSSYNTRDGGSTRLPKSSITNSYYASMTTGLIRAALSSLLVAINELIDEGHNYKIISATTDGLLYGIDETKLSVEDTLNTSDKSYNYDSVAEALADGYKKFKPFEEVDPILAERLLKFPSLRLLQVSHEAWNDPTYIEIKHIANKVVNIKTRGQVGHYVEGDKSICTILAKAGHKVAGNQDEQAEWILKHYEDDVIETYDFTVLSGIRDIVDENCVIDDLVSLPETRVISLDYDYKRVPLNAHETAPVKDVDEFVKYRQSVDYLRRLKQRATIDAVDYKFKRAKQGVRKTGSSKEMVARHILRGLVHEVKPFKKLSMSYNRLAILLREYKVTPSKIKHAKAARFTPNMIQDTTGNRVHIRSILRLLQYPTNDNYQEFLQLLLHQKITNPESVSYLD